MKTNQIEYCVFGKYALFSDPVNRMGGEKFTYQVPTYQALKGITESIYWKPSITWVIDEVRIMNPICSEAKGIRPIEYGGKGGNTLSIYTYLRDVRYHVRAHFIWNENRPELANDWNENKHYSIAKRCVERGGRRNIFLGTSECQGYVEPCVFEDEKGAYDSVHEGLNCNFYETIREREIPMGCMFHGFTYPDENKEGKMIARFSNIVMKEGIIKFLKPEECSITRELFVGTVKNFDPNKNTMLSVGDFDYNSEFGGDNLGVDE